MKIMAQVGMVMALDKCIGCHTCSVTCKQVWTNRPGAEYIWFNDVETKPGIGYPKRWEDQVNNKGGWKLNKNQKLKLASGGRVSKLLRIFSNPNLPIIDDYYEPWTYDYETLTTAPVSKNGPVATAHSALTGKELDLQWGPNWEDDLAGAPTRALNDPNMAGLEEKVKMSYEQAFMFYLPRICEHCMNPSCVASCPSGAMYKREEDGIVLVDQQQCRGWRFCVSGCPYKKVYFNHKTSKAEKCTFCYPRVEGGQPTICSETCVGRIRFLGIVLYDVDKINEAASTKDPTKLLDAQLDLFCDPFDPKVIKQAEADNIPQDWIQAAQKSPVYALAKRYRVALPLHPEFRTLPMVWYVPPLSPVLEVIEPEKDGSTDPDNVFHAIDKLRIPIHYLANLLSAGDDEVIKNVLKRLGALRSFERKRQLSGTIDDSLGAQVGLGSADLDDLYQLLAIAPYDRRYVLPIAHRERGDELLLSQGTCGIDFESISVSKDNPQKLESVPIEFRRRK